MAKQIRVECAAQTAALLEQALRWFVDRHYPHGADECSIAAREALLELADRFATELAADGRCDYSSRVRAFLTEAVNSYTQYQEGASGESWVQRRSVLIAVARGQSRGEEYPQAVSRDRQDPGVG